MGLFLAANLLVDPFFNHFVKPELISRINSEKGHRIKIDALSYSFLSNSISASEIEYVYKDEDLNITAMVPEISFRGIPWLNIISGGSLHFTDIKLYSPDVRIESLIPQKKEPQKKIIEQLRDIIPPDKKPLQIGELIVRDGKFRNRKYKAMSDDYIGNINITISDIFIHYEEESQNIPLKVAGSIDFQCGDLLWKFPETGYTLTINSINFSSMDSTADIRKVLFKSPKSPLEFFKGKKFRSNKLTLRLDEMSAAGFDLAALIKKHEFDAKLIKLSEAELEFVTDKRVPEDKSIIPQMPNELVSSLEYKINVEVLRIENSEIHVKELWTDRLISHLPFTKIRADIINLSSSAGLKHPVVFDVSSSLAGAGELKVKMKLPLSVKELRFDYEGSLDKMSVLPLNDHLRVADKTELISGEVGNVTFKVEASGYMANAGVVPVYNNLKIKSLTKESTEGGAFQDVKSLIANNLKVRESNPDKDGKIKSGNITYIRENGDFFLDIVWKSLKKALGEVVGF